VLFYQPDNCSRRQSIIDRMPYGGARLYSWRATTPPATECSFAWRHADGSRRGAVAAPTTLSIDISADNIGMLFRRSSIRTVAPRSMPPGHHGSAVAKQSNQYRNNGKRHPVSNHRAIVVRHLGPVQLRYEISNAEDPALVRAATPLVLAPTAARARVVAPWLLPRTWLSAAVRPARLPVPVDLDDTVRYQFGRRLD
jgi:hypothetical protein